MQLSHEYSNSSFFNHKNLRILFLKVIRCACDLHEKKKIKIYYMVTTLLLHFPSLNLLADLGFHVAA